MIGYLGKRLLMLLPTVLVPVIVVFLLIRLAPGDPAAQILGDQATPEQVEALRDELGLNRPLIVQFGAFLGSLVSLDLGDSLFLNKPVVEIVPTYAAVTLEIGVFALVIAALLGVGLGALSAFRRNHWTGRLATGIGVFSISVPQFLFALLLVIALAVNLRMFPVSGFVPWDEGIGPHLRSVFLPALASALAQVGLVLRLTSSGILDVLNEPFVTTARSLGVRTLRVNTTHVMRVASVQILTAVGLIMAMVLSGSVVIETIFGIPGMGRLLFDAVSRRDYDLIQGIVLFIGLFIIAVNLLVDVLYAVVDPRVQYGKATT